MQRIPMKYLRVPFAILLFCVFGSSAGPLLGQEEAADDAGVELETITVETDRVTGSGENTVDPRESTSASPDSSELVEEAAGADVTSNGAVSGQVQYRGMTGQRMNVQVNGHAITPGGPNWMDPPLHYAPRPLVDEVTVERGISSVTSGISTLGGTVKADLKSSKFTKGEDFERHGEIYASGRTADEGVSYGGIVSLANENSRFHVLGSVDEGDNRDFPDGTVRPTEYDRAVSGLGFGFRAAGDTYGVDFRHTDTGKSGNPSLPMDIQYMNTDQVELRYATVWEEQPYRVQVNYNDVGHKMDNYTLRPAPDFNEMMNPGPAFDGEDRRYILAESDDLAFHLKHRRTLGPGTLKWGFDATEHNHEATVYDPDLSNPFLVEPFEGIKRNEFSGFAEWSGPLTGTWDLTTGLRVTRVDMEAGEARTGSAAPGALEQLRTEFNASDREEEDLNIDLTGSLTRPLTRNTDFLIGVSRKTRSPSYIERFAWVPIEATAGLADGNIHVGNRKLDPEVSRKLELGLDWSGDNAYATPRLYYRDVADYIQGTPEGISSTQQMVSSVNGDPDPLKYNNVEAEIYGLDATWGHDLPRWPTLQLDGSVSFLRGRRGDIDDDLYRFAPSQGDVRLSYRPAGWLFAAEGEFVAEQDNVSSTNDETPTAGYGLMNLKARWFHGESTTVSVGVNNVFDKTYREHLAGFNRVPTSDVPVGERLPGNERNLVATVSYAW